LSERFSSRSRACSSAFLNRHTQPLCALEGLFEKIQSPTADRLHGGARRAVRGDHDDRQRLVHGVQPSQNVHPVHARHLHVEEDQIEVIPLDEREPFLPGRRAHKIVAFVLQRHTQRVANGGFIVDHQDA